MFEGGQGIVLWGGEQTRALRPTTRHVQGKEKSTTNSKDEPGYPLVEDDLPVSVVLVSELAIPLSPFEPLSTEFSSFCLLAFCSFPSCSSSLTLFSVRGGGLGALGGARLFVVVFIVDPWSTWL